MAEIEILERRIADNAEDVEAMVEELGMCLDLGNAKQICELLENG